ncbi:hypothetical protein AB0D13_23495 [Streptomyces sp. NPDC048430]|uniref:hypothetical protein n=1 Tax=Streptomyces sp. NPDC048430 TaxID=3155388 RepID=UPI003422A728
MIIDRNASVTPNGYESPRLRRTIGKRIGRADRDDMLRALLWVAEVRMAGSVAAAWREFHEELDRDLREAERRRDRLSWQRSNQVADGCRTAAAELADKLWSERHEAASSLDQCEEIATELSARLGLKPDEDGTGLPDLRAALTVLHHQLVPARQRVQKLRSHDQVELHELAMLEERQRQDASTSAPTLDQLDAMDEGEFDEAIRLALVRAGFQASARGPRAIGVTRDGETGVVFCASVQRPMRDESDGIRMMLRAQRLADGMGFDAVLVISNLRYISLPANRHIEESTPTVHLVQRFELQRWIEWGIPLESRGFC